MINQIRAEVLKIRSTRTTLGFVAGTVVLVVAITLLTGLLSDSLHTVEDQRQLFGLGSIAGLFAALAGILVITGEYRFGTIRPTFLVAPSWTRILGAKTVASMVAGVVFAVVGMVLSIGLGYLCLKQRGFPIVFHSGDWAYLLFGVIVGTAIWGGIGVGLGTLIRNQIAAVIVLLGVDVRDREPVVRTGSRPRSVWAEPGPKRDDPLKRRSSALTCRRHCGAGVVDAGAGCSSARRGRRVATWPSPSPQLGC